VQWTEDVVDNEGAGRKKSKICCIYHKPRAFDESSDESDSSGDESCDGHEHDRHGHAHDHAHSRHNAPVGDGAAMAVPDGAVVEVQFDRGPANAYEKGAGSKGKAKA